MKFNKTILIIGGMGPQASLSLHKRLIDLSAQKGAKNNDDYPEIIHVSIPVPDFINNSTNKDKALKMISSRLSTFRKSDIDEAVIACNTVHALLPDIQKVLTLRPVSLIDATVDHVLNLGLARVGLLATPSTLQSKMYHNQLSGGGVGVIEPKLSTQIGVEKMIREIIGNATPKSMSGFLKRCLTGLKKDGAEKVVLGCTELSMISQEFSDDAVIDPLQIVAKKLLET